MSALTGSRIARGTSVKAIVYTRYGAPDVLEIKEVATPRPRDNEILIKVRATTVTSGDRRVRALDIPLGFKLISRLVFGVTRPRNPILGTELAGDVVAVGKGVSKYAVGDAVFAFGGVRMGCYAQYKCMPEDAAVAKKPANLGYDEAAVLSFGGTTALHFLRRANIARGERVLVIGASGSVGSAAVQLGKHFGAQVTGVCSGANAALVRSLGAKNVIDYTQEDFAKTGAAYDIIVDAVGSTTFSRCKNLLADRGCFLAVSANLPQMLLIPFAALTGRKRVIAGPAPERAEDLHFLAKLAQAGEFKPVIDRRYPFERIVEAHRYVDSGRKRGNVVIALEH